MRVTSPSAGATVSVTITAVASASDDVGATRVEFLVDGASIETDPSAGGGWSATRNTDGVGNGGQPLTARATATANQPTTSSGVGITDDNVPPP